MQTVNVPVVDTRAMEHQTITINVVPAVVKGILTTLGAKPLEAVIPVQVEQFIISANLVLRLKQVRILQLHPITGMPGVQQDILQHGPRIAVRVAHINGMDIITFFVLYVEISAIQVQNGALCIAAQA